MARTTRHAFTLIELLVVISIIALLIGILLPSLGAARDSSRTAICGTRTKQLLTAAAAYEVDFRLLLPSYDYGMNAPDYYDFWWGRSNTAMEMVGDDEDAGFIIGYIPRGSVEGCPSLVRVDHKNYFGFVGYGYNYSHVPTGDNRYGRNTIGSGVNAIKVARRTDDIINPADKAMFCDSIRISVTSGELTMADPCGWMGVGSANRGVFSSGSTISYTDMFQGRHRGYGSVGWADGHVSRREPAYYDTSTPTTASSATGAIYSPANTAAIFKPNFLGYIDSDGNPGTREHIVLTK